MYEKMPEFYMIFALKNCLLNFGEQMPHACVASISTEVRENINIR